MKTVEYIIQDELGIHARPAGLLVKEAAKFQSSIKIAGPKKEVDAKRIMGVMSLGVKHGDTVRLTIEGADEDAAAAALEQLASELALETGNLARERRLRDVQLLGGARHGPALADGEVVAKRPELHGFPQTGCVI